MEIQSPAHLGEIIRLNQGGLAIVNDEHCHRQYPFNFDKIVDYKGQYLSELTDFSKKGLEVGIKVLFTIDPDDKVNRVYPIGV